MWAWIASHTQRKAFNNNNDVVYTEFSVLRGIQVVNLQEVKVEAGEADQVGTGETLLADEERRPSQPSGTTSLLLYRRNLPPPGRPPNIEQRERSSALIQTFNM